MRSKLYRLVASHVFASLKRLALRGNAHEVRMKKQLNSIRKKGVGGRPKLSQEAVRSRTIGVRVNELEMDKLIARAKTMGMSPLNGFVMQH